MYTMTAEKRVGPFGDDVKIHVTLGEEDAADLLAILEHIGGSPSGPRGAADRLHAALQSVHIRASHTVIQDNDQPNYFNRREEN